MTGGSGRRWAVGAGTFLAAVALALATPEAPRAASSECGGYDGSLCSQNESCVDILFYDQCTTKYTYYPKTTKSGGGGGSPGDGTSQLEDEYDFSDECMWGRDYLGWEPIGC